MSAATEAPTVRLSWPTLGSQLEVEHVQGFWTEEQYFKLTNHSNNLIEFVDGDIEAIPMPNRKHQSILALLYELFVAFTRPRGGKVLFAPLRLQIRPGKYREPDLLLLLAASDPRNQNAYWLGADLVVEIVSADDPERDTVTKRADYAEAGISEYWIVNPLDETITVLTLAGETYRERSVFRRSEQADSPLLAGFGVEVSDVFDAE